MTGKPDSQDVNIQLSKLLRISGIFFEKHPETTGFGCLLGYFLHIMVKLFKPTLKYIKFADFSSISLYEWVIVGISLTYATTFLINFIRINFKKSSVETRKE